MTVPLLPSAPKAAVVWAKAQPDLAAIHGGRVGTRLHAARPAVRVVQIGGQVVHPREGRPLLQFECWASDEDTADTLARTLVGALPTFRGVFSDGRVHTFAVESGPYWAPDDPELSQDARYIVTARLVTTSVS